MPARMASAISLGMTRVRTVGVAALLALLLAACSSQQVTPSEAPITLHGTVAQARQFFESQGGGNWKNGTLTGGTVGYAAGNGQQQFCPTVVGGATYLTTMYLFCDLSGSSAVTTTGASAVTTTQAESLLGATVEHFAPNASGWAKGVLSQVLSSTPLLRSNSTKVFGHTLVQIQTNAAPVNQISLSIRPGAA
jgi:hypothetical protein